MKEQINTESIIMFNMGALSLPTPSQKLMQNAKVKHVIFFQKVGQKSKSRSEVRGETFTRVKLNGDGLFSVSKQRSIWAAPLHF